MNMRKQERERQVWVLNLAENQPKNVGTAGRMNHITENIILAALL
jgi:hypothetical protein